MNDCLPSFCAPLDDCWPLPVALPGVQLRSICSDPTLLQPDDFALAGIRSPANILRAVAKRQTEFPTGRLRTHAALLALDGRVQMPAVGEDRAPVWPAAVSGLITHGDCWAAILVAARGDWCGFGLDVGTLLEAERVCYLHGEILTEGKYLRFTDDLERYIDLLVTLAFSLKENLFKALYPLVSKRFYFEHAELLEWCTDGQARLRLLTDLSPEWCHGSELDVQFAMPDGRLFSLVAAGA